jgi:purine-cytosine permease-like protein
MVTATAPEQGAAVDAVGQIETRGVDYIPEAERASTPRDLADVFFGTQLCFGIIVLGYLPIAFGLAWWSALSSTLVGLAVGSAVFAPLAVLSTRTGTNSAVSSGAHFGVVGRMVGSLVGVFTAVGFYALTVWTGGGALVAALAKVFGTPDGNVALGIGYAVIAVATLIVAVYGHANVVAANRFLIPSMGVLLVVGAIVLAPHFSTKPTGIPLLLSSYSATWVLSAITAASLPISYSPYVGDYTRYISATRFTPRQVMLAGGLGMFGGCAAGLTFATYVATMFPPTTTDWVAGLVHVSPTWYAVPIVLVALAGSFAQGGLCVYGTGLDTSSIFPSLKRVPATLLIGAAGTATVFVGAFLYDLVSAAGAFLILLIIVTTPWVIINLIGYRLSGGRYYAQDLQVFTMHPRVRGGAYWYTAGWNLAAMGAWVPATVVGLLFANTTLYTGPWANAAGGIDLSFLSAAVLGGVLYLVLVRLIPASFVRPDRVSEQDDAERLQALLREQRASEDQAGTYPGASTTVVANP